MQKILIVGAGVMGCVSAMRLLQADPKLDLVLLEKSLPGAESSAAAAGILGAQSEVSATGPFFELCLASRARYREFARELEEITAVSVGYEDSGVLEVALDAGEGRIAAGRAEWMIERGLRVEVLDREQARELEPGLTRHMVGANFYPDDHQVDPVQLSRALASAVARLGGRFRAGVQVRGLRSKAGRVHGVDTDAGPIDADAVVIAGGAWSTAIAGLPSMRTRVKPMAGQILLMETRPPLFRHIVYGYSGYLVPRADGRVIMGSTLEDRGFDKAVTLDGLRRISTMATDMLPALGGARLVEAWSGLRPAPVDNTLVLGEGALGGLFFATGHYRNGILLTPITGEVIRDLVLGRAPPIDIQAFKP